MAERIPFFKDRRCRDECFSLVSQGLANVTIETYFYISYFRGRKHVARDVWSLLYEWKSRGVGISRVFLCILPEMWNYYYYSLNTCKIYRYLQINLKIKNCLGEFLAVRNDVRYWATIRLCVRNTNGTFAMKSNEISVYNQSVLYINTVLLLRFAFYSNTLPSLSITVKHLYYGNNKSIIVVICENCGK